MIEIKRITPQTVELYDKDDFFLGNINEYEFMDLRVQIKREGIVGYYVMFNNEKIRIDKRGRLEKNPDGMFDFILDCLTELI